MPATADKLISAYLKLCGKHVTLYDRFPQVLAPIRTRGGIQLEGVSKTGFAKLDQICEDVAQAVDGAEIIFVVLPAFAHAYVAQELAGCLVDGQTVVVCPGRDRRRVRIPGDLGQGRLSVQGPPV